MLVKLVALLVVCAGIAAWFVIRHLREREHRKYARQASLERIEHAREWEAAHRGKRPPAILNPEQRDPR